MEKTASYKVEAIGKQADNKHGKEEFIMKNKIVSILLAIFICVVMLAGCTGKQPVLDMNMENEIVSETQNGDLSDKKNETAPYEAGEPKALEPVETEGKYEKAAYLADMVYEYNNGGNTMVSPLSLDMALGLVSGGAGGETKAELLEYLATDDYGQFAEQYMEYAEGLNCKVGEEIRYGGYQMAYEIANSIWLKDDRKLVDAYAELAGEQYEAEVAAVSFEQSVLKETVERINDWCDEKTHGLIPTIISEKSITDDTVAVLINSLYFECPWTDEWGVAEHSFTDLEGVETRQEMLRDTLSSYYENDYATAFAKNYRNGMKFIGILPKETGEFSLSELDVESLLNSETTAYDVKALMPKLQFETTAGNLVEILKSQGVEQVFDKESSDLTGLIEMNSDEITYISDIIQKTVLELDENGTKAAAVTAVTMEMCATAMPVEKKEKQVYLDRPFAFMIYDEVNDQIVFMGKVVSL